MKSRANTFLRKYAREVDATVGVDRPAHDSTAWISMGFDLAAAADHYGGIMVEGYRPGLGGSSAALSELSANYGSHVRKLLARTPPHIIADACSLAHAYGTACEGRRESLSWY